MTEDVQGYTNLRQKIVEQIIPMLDSGAISSSDRYELISQIAQLQGSLDLYEKAFAVAQELDETQKLNAFMDLLTNVDLEIQDRVSTDGDVQSPDDEQPQQPAEQS